jgi:hypothetical protein
MTDAKKYIWQYSLDEIEQQLNQGPLTIVNGNPQTIFILSKMQGETMEIYQCEHYRGPHDSRKWKHTQYGNTLTELLLRSVFGMGRLQADEVK